MEELDEGMTPFWLQATDNRCDHRRRRRPSSIFFNTGVLVILLLVIALAFVFVIIPSFLSFTSKIFKPQLVKKSWDSVNLVLVLFAVICGFLSKSNSNCDNDSRSTYDHVRRSNPSTPRQRYDYSSSSDRTAYNSLNRLRSFSSYPDLRQESSWMMNGDDRWRSYDDTDLYNNRSRSRRERDEEQVYINSTKDIAVDTVHASPPPAPPSPPAAAAAAAATASPPRPPQSPPPQPPKAVRRKPKRNYEDLKPKEKSERKEVIHSELKIKHSLPPPPAARPPPSPPPPPPPPPPPRPPIAGSEKRSNKSEKKRGGVTKEFLISLRRKKKKQRQRSVENLDEFFNLSTLPLYPPSLPPPPPPPPPLPSFYQSIFSSKKSKARKTHSVPPPPPPPSSWEARASKREPQKPPVTTQQPPLPVQLSNINNVEESVESGSESPLNSIPPPPPPPPFKMPPWKFEVHGDFVRLKSINSSKSGSPDLDDPSSGEASPSENKNSGEINSAESTVALFFCPSPDVNTKADNFIARFRAGLKLEKINSVKGRSNLGPDPGPSTV